MRDVFVIASVVFALMWVVMTFCSIDQAAPPIAPVVDPCSVELDCIALMLAGGRTPWCVGPRSSRCDP